MKHPQPFPLRSLESTTSLPKLVVIMVSRMTRVELGERLQKYHGEVAPTKWTRAQLLHRLSELEGEVILEPKSKELSPLRTLEVAINKASARKATLQEHDPDGHRDHCSAQGEGPEPGSSSSHGLRRVRQALRQEVRGDLDGTAQLCSLGDADLQGGPREQHEASSLGQVAGGDDGAGASDGSHSRAFQEPEEGLPSQEEGRREVQFILRDDGNGFSLEGAHQGGGRHEGGSGDAPEATLGRHLKRLGENLPDASGSVDGSKGFFSEGLETLLPAPQVVLSERETKLLSLQAMEELPAAFGELIRYERPLLFEVACGPDSLLTDTMRKMTGRESAAERLSFWNGYDLATSTGVRKAINKIKKNRPLHAWISTECRTFF